MVSISARLTAFALNTTGFAKKNFTGGPDMEDRLRALQRRPPDLPSARDRRRVDIRETTLSGRSVWHFAPKDQAPTAHMLFFHGGGYVMPPSAFHWSFLAHMAHTHGMAITAPLYPLAPDHHVDEIAAFALDAYRAFLDSHDGPFIMGGDSAGAGMTAMVAQAARDQALRSASGLLLICPWLDASASHPDQAQLERRDCILTIGGIRQAGEAYARPAAPSDPRVSPIHGNWTGLPPILCYAGGADILLTDARALKAKLPDIRYIELDNMMHDWPIFFFPESRKAQAEMAKFAAGVGYGVR
ncbi:alpha/beta hydrolase fold domain-containing protein [Sphingorhabdus arenilitoris]|uniref:Alpha/beta hydrolase fold domain-containing protein n=1 Tax=Sphingorhabdus arenilitoris TaxID=1490041 RepID=A0ABV8RHN1_9SPHN